MSELELDIRKELDGGIGGKSFAELTHIEGFNGDCHMTLPDKPNTILWTDMSEEAINVIAAMFGSKEVAIRMTNVLPYAMDGCVLQMPIAKKLDYDYKKPHWLPILFCTPAELDRIIEAEKGGAKFVY